MNIGRRLILKDHLYLWPKWISKKNMIGKYQLENYSFLYLEQATRCQILKQQWLFEKCQTKTFFTNIHNVIQNDTEDSFYNICVILNNLRKKILKQIGSEILQNGNMLGININNSFYNYVCDITDTIICKSKEITTKKIQTHLHREVWQQSLTSYSNSKNL